MNDQLYYSTKDEQRKNNVPFVANFEPDFDFILRRTIKEPLAIIDFNSQDGATEQDVLNRMSMMQTGITPSSASETVINQVNVQNEAIAEAQRIAAQRAAAEAQAVKDAEAVQAKIKQDAEEAFARSIQEAANKKSVELAAAAEAEYKRALADEQKAAELMVVQRSAPESIAPTPGNVAMSPDLTTETGAVLNQGTSSQKAAEAAKEEIEGIKYIQEQTKEAAAEAGAVQEMSLKGEAMAVDQSGSTPEKPSVPVQEALTKAALVQQKTSQIIKEAEAERQAANTAEEKAIAEKKLKDAQVVYNAATTIIENGGKSDDIFDMIAKWIIKNFKL